MMPGDETLSKLLGSLYGAAADPALWDLFLQQLAESTGARSAGLVMLDVGQNVFTISRSWEVDPEATRLYQEHYCSVDVWAQRGLSKPAGYVCSSEALSPPEEMATTEIYNDFMVRFGVVLMNRSARAFAAERDGLLATRDGLRAERPGESTMLGKAISQAISTSNGNGLVASGTVLVSRRARPPLQIQISPVHNSVIHTSRPIAAVAFVNDPLRTQRPKEELLRTLYALTPAECRVALLLSDGHAPRQIANMVGVTDNTVRSQIKSIFSKTGVKRQGELIRLLLNNAVPTIQEHTAL
jgi:DNA-binding CsgD family transcriptional regulator